MGTDFSIKPVGAPAMAPAIAAADAVATELPPAQTVMAVPAGAGVGNDPQSAGDDTLHQAFVDRAAGLIVYQVVDARTNLVVRQFPDEVMLRRRAYFRALDLTRSVPARVRVTDRTA
jgi:hypothetical protein